MAKLLRTGFEKYNTTEYYWSWNSIEGNGDGLIIQTRTGASSDRITNDHSGALMSRYLTPDFYSYYDYIYTYPDTTARSKSLLSDGTYRGVVSSLISGQQAILKFDTSKIQEGVYMNWWMKWVLAAQGGVSTSETGLRYAGFFNSVADNCINVYIAADLDNQNLRRIYIADKDGIVAQSANVSYNQYDWINIRLSMDNSGVLYTSFNGVELSYDTKLLSWTDNSGAWSQWDSFLGIASSRSNDTIDDIAINDGSGGVDNSIPGSISCFNCTPSFLLNSSSGVTKSDPAISELEILADNSNTTFLTLDEGGKVELSVADLSDFIHNFDENNYSGVDSISLRVANSAVTDFGRFAKLSVEDLSGSSKVESEKALSMDRNQLGVFFDQPLALGKIASANIKASIEFIS